MSKQDTIISLLKEIDKNIDNVGGGGTVSKVKVSTFKVNDACINDDGIWEGENAIDLSECNSFYFGSNKKIKILKLKDAKKITNFYQVFMYCENLISLELRNFDFTNTDSARQCIQYCTNLEILDLRDTISMGDTDFGFMFNNTGKITTLVGGATIDDIVSNNISILYGLKSFNATNIGANKNLDRASLRALINGLADLTGSDAKTLTIGETLIAKLTEEDIAIATAKNWTIA